MCAKLGDMRDIIPKSLVQGTLASLWAHLLTYLGVPVMIGLGLVTLGGAITALLKGRTLGEAFLIFVIAGIAIIILALLLAIALRKAALTVWPKPRLKCSFDMADPGCVIHNVPLVRLRTQATTISSPWTSSVSVVYGADLSEVGISEEAIYDPPASLSAMYYRLKVEVTGSNQLSDRYRQLISIRRGTVELLPGEPTCPRRQT
jgi:hypothetical protein